jgi:hypothetical protein
VKGGSVPDHNDHPEDETLLDELQALFDRTDPVPDELVPIAEAGLVLRTIDSDLASLTYDSDQDRTRLALVRGVPAVRLLTFEGTAITVEIESGVVGGSRRLVGQLLPAGRAEVEVSHQGGVIVTLADELGRFVVPAVAAGLVSIHGRAGGASGTTSFRTDWFVA